LIPEDAKSVLVFGRSVIVRLEIASRENGLEGHHVLIFGACGL
jgi:hypothetical protein